MTCFLYSKPTLRDNLDSKFKQIKAEQNNKETRQNVFRLAGVYETHALFGSNPQINAIKKQIAAGIYHDFGMSKKNYGFVEKAIEIYLQAAETSDFEKDNCLFLAASKLYELGLITRQKVYYTRAFEISNLLPAANEFFSHLKKMIRRELDSY